MWTAIDGAFDQSNISPQETINATGAWRWGFADLPDDGIKGAVADVLVKALLGVDPATMSPKELQVLSMCSVAVPEQGRTDTGLAFDA